MFVYEIFFLCLPTLTQCLNIVLIPASLHIFHHQTGLANLGISHHSNLDDDTVLCWLQGLPWSIMATRNTRTWRPRQLRLLLIVNGRGGVWSGKIVAISSCVVGNRGVGVRMVPPRVTAITTGIICWRFLCCWCRFLARATSGMLLLCLRLFGSARFWNLWSIHIQVIIG